MKKISLADIRQSLTKVELKKIMSGSEDVINANSTSSCYCSYNNNSEITNTNTVSGCKCSCK